MQTPTKLMTITTLTTFVFLGWATESLARNTPMASDAARAVEVCIDEIAKHANYAGAKKVRHFATEKRLRRVGGNRVSISTTVFLKTRMSDRIYETVCVTGTFGRIVDFRLETVGN